MLYVNYNLYSSSVCHICMHAHQVYAYVSNLIRFCFNRWIRPDLQAMFVEHGPESRLLYAKPPRGGNQTSDTTAPRGPHGLIDIVKEKGKLLDV